MHVRCDVSGRAPYIGYWSIPGGSLEHGETLATGCAREVHEECGIHVRVGGVCAVTEVIKQDGNGRCEA